MTVRELLGQLKGAGVELEIADGKLRARSWSGSPPEDLRASIREHRDTLRLLCCELPPGPATPAMLLQALERDRLAELIESVCVRMAAIATAPAEYPEWARWRDSLLADLAKAEAALAARGEGFEAYGWTLGPKLRWERIEAADQGAEAP